VRINHNLSALNAWKNMAVNDGGQAKSLEKLSSGLRIGRAADDAAGLSISEKMRGQISGLNQASRNAQDGISLLQTAEGALQETHSILQRMRELAVQAASDTVTELDRKEIQKEINELRVEIDRISTDTEFNTQKLLNGGFTNRIIHIGANASQNLRVTVGAMGASDLQVNGTTGGSPATQLASVAFTPAHAGNATLTVNGTYTGGADIAAMAVSVTEDGKVTITGTRDGDDLEVTLDSETLSKEVDGLTFTLASASDVRANATKIGTGPTSVASGSGPSPTSWTLENAGSATLTLTGTATANITDISANVLADGQVEISYKADGAADSTTAVLQGSGDSLKHVVEGLTFELTEPEDIRSAPTIFTWGSGQINAAVASGDVAGAGIDVSTQAAANAAITTINKAINSVSSERSKLGAIQNRLEHTIANLATSSENLTAAESRIRDVDIAVEMMNFTKYQILSQASTAMLAQANAKPQAVLQLLR
jgi:flagellin